MSKINDKSISDTIKKNIEKAKKDGLEGKDNLIENFQTAVIWGNYNNPIRPIKVISKPLDLCGF